MHRFKWNLNIIKTLAEHATLKGHPENVIAIHPSHNPAICRYVYRVPL